MLTITVKCKSKVIVEHNQVQELRIDHNEAA